MALFLGAPEAVRNLWAVIWAAAVRVAGLGSG